MTDTPNPSLSKNSAEKLDDQAVLKAVTALCGPDRAARSQIRKGLKRLLASDDWSTAIGRLERMGLSAKHFRGPLLDILSIPGDLVLLRNGDGEFSLVYRMEQRWQYLGEDGAPLSAEVNVESGADVEAVVLEMPRAADKSGGFA
ncbi:MAG: hypothetical protein ABR605_05995, partial [Desulfurivibrionaceae bacterium]